MLIVQSLIFHHSYHEKWIFDDNECFKLWFGTIKSLQANCRHCSVSGDTSVWRLIEFH